MTTKPASFLSGIFIIIFVAFLIRLIPLNQSLWLDQAINVTAVTQNSPTDLITKYAIGDFHPPLYHLVLYYWVKLVGNNEISARLPSALFGLVTIWFSYLISRHLLEDKKIELLGLNLSINFIPAILLATSGLHIYYSGEARMYSAAAAFTTMAVYFLIARKKTTTSKIQDKDIFLVLSLVAMLLTDYVPWLLFPVFFIYFPIHSSLALLTTAPWWPYFYRQLQVGLTTASEFPGWGQVVGAFSLKNLVLVPVKFLVGRVSIDNNFVFGLILLLPLLIAGFLFFKAIVALKTNPKFNQKMILFWFFVPLVIGALLSFKISLFSYFRFLFILPAFYLTLTLGLSHLTKKIATQLLLVLVIVNFVSTTAYLFLPQFHREDWRGLSTWIDQQNQPSALTIFPSLAQAAPYLYYQHQVSVADKVNFNQPPKNIYLMRYVQEIFDPLDSHRQLIEEEWGYQFVEQKNFNGVVVFFYQYPGEFFAQSTF